MTLGNPAEVQMGYPFRSRLEHDPAGEISVIQMKDIDVANLVRVDRFVDASRDYQPGKNQNALLPEEEIDVAAVEREIERLESELAEVRVRMKQYLKELGL